MLTSTLSVMVAILYTVEVEITNSFVFILDSHIAPPYGAGNGDTNSSTLSVMSAIE